jgi:hypothetical protein
LIDGADKLFQVSTRNHVSALAAIDKERAHRVVKDAAAGGARQGAARK